MIRRLFYPSEIVFADDTVVSGYARSLYEAYGLSFEFLQFYRDDGACVIAVMDGIATVSGQAQDVEELAWFLSMQSEIKTVRTDTINGDVLQKFWQSNRVDRPVMRCVCYPEKSAETVLPPVRELYALLSSTFNEMPTWDGWYLDVCYRLRHDACHIAAVMDQNRVVSSAMTVAEWGTGAVIGAVATDAEYRRKGYGSRCVSSLTVQMLQQGKHVYICPKTSQAQRLYETIGFSVCDSITLLDIPERMYI